MNPRCYVFTTLFALAIVVTLCLQALMAQTTQTGGTVVGTITDQSGAIIPGVKIELSNSATNFTRTAETNKVGGYTLPNIPPGEYKITVSSPGFRIAVVQTVSVEVRESHNTKCRFVSRPGF